MRGALPDAECPRCGETRPPTWDARLVTCAGCGLVFAPHEVLHVPRRAFDGPTTEDGPASLVLEHDADTLTIHWPTFDGLAFIALLLAVLFGVWLATSTAWWEYALSLPLAALFGYAGVSLLIGGHTVIATPSALSVSSPLPLYRARTIPRGDLLAIVSETGDHVAAILRDGSRLALYTAPDARAAAFFRKRLAAFLYGA